MDLVMLLVFTISASFTTRSLRKAFLLEMRYRFRDDMPLHRAPGIEHRTLIQWALVCLGGIPCQTIKLVAMQGIPLTKTWALLYFIPFVLGEVLTLTATHLVRDTEVFPDPADVWYKSRARNALRFIPFAALICHVCLLYHLILRKWAFTVEPMILWSSPNIILGLSLWFFALFAAVISWAYAIQRLHNAYTRYATISLESLIDSDFHLECSLSIVSISVGNTLGITMLSGEPNFDLSYYLVFVSPIFCFFAFVLGLCFIIPHHLCFLLISFLHGMPWPRQLGLRRPGIGSRLGLMAIYTLAISLFSYAFIYDSTGTSNPKWTSVLG